MIEQKLKKVIRDVQDFPIKGVLFRDIMPIFQDHQLCAEIVDAFIEELKDYKIDVIAGIESRGFLFGMLLAQRLKVPFVPIRKEGKLPGNTTTYSYNLEYGSATLEVQKSSFKAGQNVLIHDDLLATGGTAYAASELVKKQGANVKAFAFLVTLDFLDGKQQLLNHSSNVINLVSY